MNNNDKLIKLSLIIPVFNEAEMVNVFLQKITPIFAQKPTIDVEFIFINDGSTDETLNILLIQQKNDSRLTIIDLSRNFGKEAAITAGLDAANGDAIIPIDIDLQDPPEIILAMIEKWREGYEVVLGRRINRDADSWPKRFSARWFYRIHNKFADPKLPKDVGDFRLMDRLVVQALNRLPESRRFMKGLFAWVGFRTTHIDYVRPSRVAGITKFNGWKLWNLAIEGITSFSISPLRIWSYVGFIVSMSSFAFALFILIKVIIYGVEVPGYASLAVAITFIGGLQLIGIGIIGEYLGRAYMEAKRRPVYLIRHTYHHHK